jgi:23S rRNA (uracil1939-C5)-methyltransferase
VSALRTTGSGQTAAPCAHYPECAGCSLIGTPYGKQLALKQLKVLEAFAPYPTLAGFSVPEIIGAPHSFGYRNQAKLVVRRARRGLLLGIYRPGTHQVIDLRECPVHHPLINEVLARTRIALEHAEVPVYDERTATGWLRYVVLRISGWQRRAQVILVAHDARWAGLRSLTHTLRRLRGVSGVLLNVNATSGNVIFGEEFRVLSGDEGLVERVGGLKLMCRAGSFLQPNIGAARRVYERVLAWAAPEAGETAVDLYAGVGAISFCLATRARSVWGIEESPGAVLDAKRNIRLNGVHNVRFVAGEAAPRMREITERLGKIDLVTLNPPRKGADEPAREAIVQAAPSRIVYVSCDPVSLARDLDWLAARNYGLVAIQPFDMLPQTEHVETVVLLASTAWRPAA